MEQTLASYIPSTRTYLKGIMLSAFFLMMIKPVNAQTAKTADSTERWNFHYQLTVINQSHAAFQAPYSGDNSLSPQEEEALSLTTTIYVGKKLWKGGSLYFNPEISGGSGLSSTRGMAGFPNGETFRIGTTAPGLYLARLFYRQYFALGKQDSIVETDANQLRERVPVKCIVFTAGKISLSDMFDANTYSHDPRMQFFNWALMANGAWDYPANTRGYTDAIALEYISPSYELRAALSLEPTDANGPDFDYHFTKSNGLTLEFVKNLSIKSHKGAIRLLAYRNVNKAPSYGNVINAYLNNTDPSLNVLTGTTYGSVKYGLGLNAEQELTNNLGMFLRAGWNDGKTATWAFTEIDRTASLGLTYAGKQWHRPDDKLALAVVVNGISADHRAFLSLGGYGFIIGDGKLTNYKTENILEAFYDAKLTASFYLTADYQYAQNPAYNADRGPVNIFAIRAHVEF